MEPRGGEKEKGGAGASVLSLLRGMERLVTKAKQATASQHRTGVEDDGSDYRD